MPPQTTPLSTDNSTRENRTETNDGIVSSPSNLAASFTPVDYAEEFDATERQCILYRYCRPVESAFPWLRNSGLLHAQHWALVAHFPQGNRYLMFEANENPETLRLEASVSTLLWSGRTEVTTELLGKVTTSPKKLLELAKNHPQNHTLYSVTFNNCQEWLKTFLNIILDVSETCTDGVSFETKMVTYMDDMVGRCGHVWGSVLGVFGDVAKRLTGALGSVSPVSRPAVTGVSHPFKNMHDE